MTCAALGQLVRSESHLAHLYGKQASWLPHRPMVSPCMPAQVKHLGQDQEDVPGAYPD